ncbi:imidazole glycerol phosphate synthase subunit HisH [Clostridium weizhouense]|uniref:Imidazole glycerol phosphate synthase subunit HisH n=1 Tax=Clostridium weizhouense TaxID=2859781 RepID=A0ABS7AKI4_9CLOT|nr:imidazole glycerol phosphate synthase subunit HisH [Clostridium weizhouense]MBW6409178.1 imidazole glycerol phosphate synthase subunit HisH [Clostridium weizhouense]
MIVIIDYGMGNLKSVYNALKSIGLESKISSNKDDIIKAKALILPGVGSFKDAMDNIEKESLDDLIKNEVKKGKFILGICLGMQLFFEKGFEVEERSGLGLLKGNVIKMKENIKDNIKIPHIGWNNLIYSKDDNLLEAVEEGEFVYYVHSYYAQEYDADDLVAYSEYGTNKIPGIVRNNNVIGIQFHPEKSSNIGLKLLKNFGEMIK